MEWATNVKLVNLAGKGLRKAIPKGLPYFAVNFGDDDGFAHVIEDENAFPPNFAQVQFILAFAPSNWNLNKLMATGKRISELMLSVL